MQALYKRFQLSFGKFRRGFLITFARGSVREKLAERTGHCNRCGACCKILFKCPAYDDSDGVPKCLAYNSKPGVCSLFPFDKRDLNDRDIVMPEVPCGFDFDKPTNGTNGSTISNNGVSNNDNSNGNGKARFPWEVNPNIKATSVLFGPLLVAKVAMKEKNKTNGKGQMTNDK